MSETYLTVSDVAKELGVVPDRVRQLARSGAIPCIKTRSGTRLFIMADVKELVQKRDRQRWNSENSPTH